MEHGFFADRENQGGKKMFYGQNLHTAGVAFKPCAYWKGLGLI